MHKDHNLRYGVNTIYFYELRYWNIGELLYLRIRIILNCTTRISDEVCFIHVDMKFFGYIKSAGIIILNNKGIFSICEICEDKTENIKVNMKTLLNLMNWFTWNLKFIMLY